MRHLLLAFVTSILGATAAVGADGSSGCGPGWYIFKENSLVSSSLRNTTHGFLFPSVTFGMTSGTSNCASHKIVLDEKRGLHFVTMNDAALMGDIAAGRGEYLSAFAVTMGCSIAAEARFGAAMQASFPRIYPSDATAPEAVVDGVRAAIRSDAVLARECVDAA